MSEIERDLERLVKAVHPILAAYRSTGTGRVTQEQITAAWDAYDAARLRLSGELHVDIEPRPGALVDEAERLHQQPSPSAKELGLLPHERTVADNFDDPQGWAKRWRNK